MCPPSPSTPATHPPAGRADIHRAVPFIPHSHTSIAALVSAGQHLPVPILNHSMRTYLYAAELIKRELYEEFHEPTPRTLDLLFVAAIHHDLGATTQFNGDQRFEVEGADAAVSFLRSFSDILAGEETSETRDVWLAIALHTSPGIAERAPGLTRLIRLGVLADFAPAKRQELGLVSYGESIEAELPRLDIEKMLGDNVVAQALEKPNKAPPASWAGVLLRAHEEDPSWQGVNKAF